MLIEWQWLPPCDTFGISFYNKFHSYNSHIEYGVSPHCGVWTVLYKFWMFEFIQFKNNKKCLSILKRLVLHSLAHRCVAYWKFYVWDFWKWLKIWWICYCFHELLHQQTCYWEKKLLLTCFRGHSFPLLLTCYCLKFIVSIDVKYVLQMALDIKILALTD